MPFVTPAGEELGTDPAAVLDQYRPWAVFSTAGPTALVAACAARGVRFVTFSDNLVGDGRPVPPAVVGAVLTEAERRVLAADGSALIVRTHSRGADDLCHATLDLLIDGETGVWSVAALEAGPWHEPDLGVARLAAPAGLRDTAVGLRVA